MSVRQTTRTAMKLKQADDTNLLTKVLLLLSKPARSYQIIPASMTMSTTERTNAKDVQKILAGRDSNRTGKWSNMVDAFENVTTSANVDAIVSSRYSSHCDVVLTWYTGCKRDVLNDVTVVNQKTFSKPLFMTLNNDWSLINL